MAARKLDRKEWQSFFAKTWKDLASRQVFVEVFGSELGDQAEISGVRLLGITYDPKDDLFEIAADGIDHLVAHPREIYLDKVHDDLLTLMVVEADGQEQLVRVRGEQSKRLASDARKVKEALFAGTSLGQT